MPTPPPPENDRRFSRVLHARILILLPPPPPPKTQFPSITSVLPTFFACASIQDTSVSSDKETDGLNMTTESHTDDGSLYVPTPQRMVRENLKNVSSNIVCFMDLNQFDKFIKQVNEVCCCATPGCKGALTPVYVKSVGLGGAVSISCTCSGCGNRGVMFETSAKYALGSATEISIGIQVAFIIGGCTYTTYYKVLKHAFGIEAVSWPTFQSTIKRIIKKQLGLIS